MALPLCFEALIRSIFVLIKVGIDNWFYFLGLIVLIGLFFKNKFKILFFGIIGFFVIAFVLSLFGSDVMCEFANWIATAFQ